MIILSGCATLQVPEDKVFPFRASFEGTAVIDGEEHAFQGAMKMVSSTSAFAQVYGPAGITLYSVNASQDLLIVNDMWGKPLKKEALPQDGFLRLLAGLPPDSPYIWKSTEDRGSRLIFHWGTLILDRFLLPLDLDVRTTPAIHAAFLRDGRTITLMMTRGSDKVVLTMQVLEGGRWEYGISLDEKGESLKP